MTSIADPQWIVAELHDALGLPILESTRSRCCVRAAGYRSNLTGEDVREALTVMRAEVLDLAVVADGAADKVSVAYGCPRKLGIVLSAVLAHLHRSNMTKAGTAGHTGGRVLKESRFEPPQIGPIGLTGEGAHRVRVCGRTPDEHGGHP